MTRQIHQITFGADERGPIVHVAYFDTDNLRVGGNVALVTTAEISLNHPDYAEDATVLSEVALRLLNNALEDFEESGPWEPPKVRRREVDDEGMGMGHGERS